MVEIRLINIKMCGKQVFQFIDFWNICIYLCGLMVYDRVYLGNVWFVVVIDMLVCLLYYVFGVDYVIYVCNFIDVDDKINVIVLQCQQMGVFGLFEELICECIVEIIEWYYVDMDVLVVLCFDYELCVMDFILQMIEMIQ